MAQVILRNISCTAGRVTPVSDVSLEIMDGEFAVVVGPSGSGKSTLVRLIAGLEEISQGEIFIDERRVNDVSPKDRDVAMIFRDYALYPHMSVYENITFGLKLRKFPKTELNKRAQNAAAILGIEQLLARKPDALSAEQRLRVALGRVMVRQPKVILFEEPLANLDAALQMQMRTEITKLHQRLQTTMIYTTRDSVEAMSLSDRVVVLNDGVVQQSDSPSAIYHAPANMFVAGFLGRPAMNLIHGTLKQERDSLLFREREDGTIEARLPVADRPGAVAFAGKSVVLGIRPEDIEVVPPALSPRNSATTFPALLEVVEAIGAERNLYLQTGAHTLICRTRNAITRGEAGRRMRFAIDQAEAHFFDPESTRRIA